MSRRFNQKKEAFEILNEELSDLIPIEQRILKKEKEGQLPSEEPESRHQVPQAWLDEQAALFRKYKLVERVYRFYRNIIQNMSSNIICIDMTGCITFMNVNAAKTLGYAIDELLGKNLTDMFAEPAKDGRIIDLMLLSNKRFESKEVSMKSKAGQVIPIGFSTSALIENEEQIGVIIAFRDLTEVQVMRKQVERMERLATLGELATGIAHEVRNPLGGIKAASQVLEESFDQYDSRLELVSRIVREADRVNNLLMDFFKFAKPVKPSQSYHDVESIIDSIYLLLAAQLKVKRIQFKEEFSDVVPKIYADANQIEQVLMNVFLNAIQAMPNGGTLTIRSFATTMGKNPQVTWSQDIIDKDMPFVAIQISDTGIGIPKENIEKIFNPFFTTKQDGLGLGLSICHRLVTQNNGSLFVESEPGKGTTFTLLLPTR